MHFGHQTRRWNPKMRRFIHGERGGIYIIDLLKTEALLAQAQQFASEIAHRGGTVLFVGTKKQARDAIKEIAEAAGMPYVNHRWLGGLLTNFQTISLRIKRLHDLERYASEGQLALLPTRERMSAEADLDQAAGQPRRRQEHAAPARRDVRRRPQDRGDRRQARRSACGSRSSGSSTPTATPTASTTWSRATTTRSAPATSITRAIGDVVAEGRTRFRTRGGARRASRPRSRRAARPRSAPARRPRSRPAARPRSARRRGGAGRCAPASGREAAAARRCAGRACAPRRRAGRAPRLPARGRSRAAAEAPAEAAPAAEAPARPPRG